MSPSEDKHSLQIVTRTSRDDFTSDDTVNNLGQLCDTVLATVWHVFARSRKNTKVMILDNTRFLICALYRVSNIPDGTLQRPFVNFSNV